MSLRVCWDCGEEYDDAEVAGCPECARDAAAAAVIEGQESMSLATTTNVEGGASLGVTFGASADVGVWKDDEQAPAEAMASQGVTTEAVVWAGAEGLADHLVAIADLQPFPGNARRGDVPAIAQSLQRFGQVRPIVITHDGTIVAGHHVVKAAQLLEWTHVAAVPVEFESRDDARAYLIADNQLATLGYVEPVDQMTLLEEIEQKGDWEGTGYTAQDLADMRALSIHRTQMIEIETLQAHPQNYREHPEDQLEHLTRSLLEHGFYRNVVVAKDGTILAGHGIVRAAKEIGLSKIPVTRLDVEPDSPEALKIVAGDNELGRLGDLDDRALSELLKTVQESGDVSALVGTGFDPMALANLLMVTRPAHEISGHNAAIQWFGIDGFERGEEPYRISISCETEEDRNRVLELLELKSERKKVGRTSAFWWPDRPLDDMLSLRWDFDDEGGATVEGDDGEESA